MNLRNVISNLKERWRQAPHKGRFVIAEIALRARVNLRFLSFRTKDGSRICFHDEGIPWGLWKGTYGDHWSIQFCLDWLKEGETAIDVGANIGHFAVAMACKVGPKGRILAFEPNPKLVRCVLENAHANALTNIVCKPYALSDRDAISTFFIPKRHSGEAALGRKAKFGHYRQVQVQCRSFASLASELDLSDCPIPLMKVDVEGYELDVFRGLGKTVEHIHAIMFEFDKDNYAERGTTGEEVLAFVSALGFSIFQVDSGAQEFRTPATDVLSCDLIAVRDVRELTARTGYRLAG